MLNVFFILMDRKVISISTVAFRYFVAIIILVIILGKNKVIMD